MIRWFKKICVFFDEKITVDVPIEPRDRAKGEEENHYVLFPCCDSSCPWRDIGSCGNDMEKCSREMFNDRIVNPF